MEFPTGVVSPQIPSSWPAGQAQSTRNKLDCFSTELANFIMDYIAGWMILGKVSIFLV